MKFYYNVLSQELLNICKDDILQKEKEHIWGSSFSDWHSDLLTNINGSCLMTHISDEKIKISLTQELFSGALKNFNGILSYQYYVWNPYSAIHYHDDHCYEFGATIYLNSNNIEDGGLFLWKDKYSSENFYKCLNPQENMMVLNDNKENHFVTSVSPYRKERRYTIQIFSRLDE